MSSFDDVSVVVLAGGKGTRIQGIYPDIPKPLVPVAGKPFLYWLTQWLAMHGPRHFIYSTGHMSDRIAEWSSNETLPGIERICLAEPHPLGTGGGLLNCLDFCRDWILVANGDGLVMTGIDEILALRQTDGVDGALLGIEVADAVRYGSLAMDETGRLTGFREKVPGSGTINGGFYMFRKKLLLPYRRGGCVSIEQDLFPDLIADGANLRVLRLEDAPFIDIGTPETLTEAASFVRTHFPAEFA